MPNFTPCAGFVESRAMSLSAYTLRGYIRFKLLSLNMSGSFFSRIVFITCMTFICPAFIYETKASNDVPDNLLSANFLHNKIVDAGSYPRAFNSVKSTFKSASPDTFNLPVKHVPDWQLKEQEGHYYSSEFPLCMLGDVNGDGIDDILYVITVLVWPAPQLAYVYYGSTGGISPEPDLIITLGISEPELYTITSVSGVGDINGDGYDDVIFTGYYYHPIQGRRTSEFPLIFYGGSTGLSSTPVRIEMGVDGGSGNLYPPTAVHKLNDVNGDGFDDMLFSFDGGGMQSQLVYGTPTENYQPAPWPSDFYTTDVDNEPMPLSIYNGDFNNDGYADLAHYRGQLYIFYGSATGLKDEHQQHINLFGGGYQTFDPYIISGDFDGDGFTDIILEARVPNEDINVNDSRWITVFIRGTQSLLDTDNYLLIQDYNATYYGGNQINALGDINNDGFDDFTIGAEIHFGGVIGPSYVKYFEANKLLYATDDYPTSALQNAGDLNGDGSNDFSNSNGRAIYYNPRYEPFSMNCVDTVEHCFNEPGTSYSIPLLEISNSHFTSVGFAIWDTIPPINPKRADQSLDASGTFNMNSTIYWTARGYNNIILRCTTQFRVKYVPITPVSIKDAYTVSPGGKPNTIYIGHGSDGFRLAALPGGGGGPYSYQWSNGSTEKNPMITERVVGEYPYWVKLTNANGCEESDTVIVKVENALCSSPLVDLVMSQYPSIMQHAVLANLIKNNSKVAVCKDGQTLCLDKSVIDIRLQRAGYSLGPCVAGIIPPEAFMTDEVEELLKGNLKVIVAPNPSSHSFQLSVVSIYNAPVMIRIMDLAGRQVEVLNNVSANQTITVGHKLIAGTYIAEVVSGKERKVVKLVKMN